MRDRHAQVCLWAPEGIPVLAELEAVLAFEADIEP